MADQSSNASYSHRSPVRRTALSHELFHGLSPEEFDREARSLADAQAMTPRVRGRLEAQLLQRLRTPVDAPSWGPDWVRRGERAAAPRRGAGWFGRGAEEEDATPDPLGFAERDDAAAIMGNLEKSRQVAHYRPLYLLAVIIGLAVALLAMFVDYQIIRGDVWTRALSNEFMVVPASLQSSVVFKSLQVIFAVLIVHVFLKISGRAGRNAMIAVAFVFALVMIGGLGYLVAYNNMAGATSATLDQPAQAAASPNSAIDALFTTSKPAAAPANDGVSLGLPKLSNTSLANADSWFWLAFASVIFFIVTTVAALYMLTVEQNVRNLHIARDHRHRERQLAQLHLLQLADKRP
ncbi:MAG: hypothetical protein WDN03_04565 [Rhizomicrobium sp.]